MRSAVTGLNHNESVTYSHTSCYRGLVPIELVHAVGIKTNLTARPICFVGPGKVVSFILSPDIDSKGPF